MRGKLKFRIVASEESLVGALQDSKLKENAWLVKDPTSPKGEERTIASIIEAVKSSIFEVDVEDFVAASKFIVIHSKSNSKGTLSYENGTWILRLLNDSVGPLKRACEKFTQLISDFASKNSHDLHFDPPIRIMEEGKNISILEGYPLAVEKDKTAYIRDQKHVELLTIIVGSIAIAFLAAVTYPWHWFGWRNFDSHEQNWGFSILEKMIGSVTVTTLLATFHYRSFIQSLYNSPIKWDPSPN